MPCGGFGQNGSNKRSVQTYTCTLSSLRKRRFRCMPVLRKTQHPGCQKGLRHRKGCRWRPAAWPCRFTGRRDRRKRHPVCLSFLRSKMEQISNPRTASAARGSFLLPYLIAARVIRLSIQSANVPVLALPTSPSALTFYTRRTFWPFRSFLHSRPKRKRSILPHKTTTLSSGAFYPMPTLRSTDRNIFLPASLDTVPILHHRKARKEAST